MTSKEPVPHLLGGRLDTVGYLGQNARDLMRGSAPVAIGELLADKYRVERVVGVGGMGTVVAATHLELERTVAIKFMRPEALEDRVAVERFIREARAAVRLRSEHVARVMDVGRMENGAPYLVMELLDGCDLATYRETQGRLTVDVASDYILQACEAVAEAHALGIVHRDLKSANLFLTQGMGGAPLIKVLDFGISKVIPVAEQLTSTANVLGSPAYMSPEQIRSARTVDARSDIWSLGVVLFELTQGYPPFMTETSAIGDVCVKVMMDPPPPQKGVPAGFAAVVDRCLEKDPAARFQTVADLAKALRPYARTRASTWEGDGPEILSVRPRRTGLWLMAGALVAIAAVGVALALRRQPVPGSVPPPAPVSVPAPPPAPTPAAAMPTAIPTIDAPAAPSEPPPPTAPRRKNKAQPPVLRGDDEALRSRH
jgi:eukaryotic-like serine/threonine-protein kinase